MKNGDYNLVIDMKENGLKKIQVRTTYCMSKNKNYLVNLRVCGGNRSGQKIKKFNKNLYDYLFVVTENNVMYFISVDDIKTENQLTLSKDKDIFIVS